MQEEYKSPEYVNVKLNEYESESENYESENESENDYRNEVVYRNENVNNLSQNSVDDEEVFTNAQAEDRAADVSAQNKTRRASTREKKKPQRYGDPITNCIYVNVLSANRKDCFKVDDCNLRRNSTGEKVNVLIDNELCNFDKKQENVKVRLK